MALNKAKGNMYGFVTHTWNPIKGACPHGCTYCYMNKIYNRFGKEPSPPHLVESELRTNLGSGNTIFVGSSIDLFARDIPVEWIYRVIEYAKKHSNNTYLWHTKNPRRATNYLPEYRKNHILCATLETNIHFPRTMGKTLSPTLRTELFDSWQGRKMITIEPVLDFDMGYFVRLIRTCGNIEQVNIGADSGNNHLPEPPKEKLLEFISELEKFTTVYQKPNLERLLK